jgi:hypothetical protein
MENLYTNAVHSLLSFLYFGLIIRLLEISVEVLVRDRKGKGEISYETYNYKGQASENRKKRQEHEQDSIARGPEYDSKHLIEFIWLPFSI